MKAKFLPLCALLFAALLSHAQSSTTEALSKQHDNALTFFFYNNTLRMLNQKEDKEFDELIKDIEKMRFLMINKDESDFQNTDFKELVADYKAESFEEIMTGRHQGKNFDVFMKEKNGKTNGMLVLINDSTTLYVLDILGRIALDKVTKLYSILDESSDISGRIKDFTGDGDDNRKKDQDDDDDKKSENH